MGYDFATAEGSYHFVPDYNLYPQTTKLPKSWNAWLDFLAYDIHNYDEGGLKISTEEKRLAITKLENFIQKYPKFVAINDVEDLLEKYMQYYILPYAVYYNSDLIVAFDSDEKTGKEILRQEYRNSYENFLKENKKSKYYPLVQEYYLLLRENDFYKPENIKEWFKGKLNQ